MKLRATLGICCERLRRLVVEQVISSWKRVRDMAVSILVYLHYLNGR
jgi:hypothetical protein